RQRLQRNNNERSPAFRAWASTAPRCTVRSLTRRLRMSRCISMIWQVLADAYMVRCESGEWTGPAYRCSRRLKRLHACIGDFVERRLNRRDQWLRKPGSTFKRLINRNRQGVLLKFGMRLEERRPFAVIERHQRGRVGKRVKQRRLWQTAPERQIGPPESRHIQVEGGGYFIADGL